MAGESKSCIPVDQKSIALDGKLMYQGVSDIAMQPLNLQPSLVGGMLC